MCEMSRFLYEKCVTLPQNHRNGNNERYIYRPEGLEREQAKEAIGDAGSTPSGQVVGIEKIR